MLRPVQFTYPGEPVAKGRPRARGGVIYTPPETKKAEAALAAFARPLFGTPYAGPVRLHVVSVFGIPKSWPKAMREAALRSPHLFKPDWDNLAKLVADALNGIAYLDDSQIFETAGRKRYGLNPETRVTVEFIGEDGAQVALRHWLAQRTERERKRRAAKS